MKERHKKNSWTRGEELAIYAMRLFSDSSLREIGKAIGRSPDSISTHLANDSMRSIGWRDRAFAFITTNK